MNLLVKTLTTICTITISTISIAQHRDRGNEISRSPQQQFHQTHLWAYNHHPHHENTFKHPIRINHPEVAYAMHLKKITKSSIRQSA